jgi:trehalose-6-phosphate synthase
MPEDEKRRRVRHLRQVIARRDLRDWLRRQSEDLDRLAEERDASLTEEAQPPTLVGHPTCAVKSMAA